MTIEMFLAILIKRWWLVLICCIAIGLGAYTGSKLLTPLYQSTALVEVSIRSGNNQSDYTNLLASDQLVQTEAQLATSDPVIREVASRYPPLTVDQVFKKVTATPKLNTQLFGIDVLDSNPTRAAALANEVATVLIEQQNQGVKQDSNQAEQQVQDNLKSTQQQIEQLTIQIATLQAAGGNSVQVAVLQTRLNSLQQHATQWQILLAQLELAKAQSSQSNDFLRVVQAAQPQLSPVQPNKLMNTGLGLILGLLLGMLLAVVIEKLDTRVRTPEAITELVGWPVLGSIWHANSTKKKDVLNPEGADIYVESYRILRTSLGFSAIDKSLHTLMVTSALPHEGKSVISANLAIFLAKAGKSTLLIDADLRQPAQSDLFDLSPDELGFSNVILAMSMPNADKSSPDLKAYSPDSAAPQVSISDASLETYIHSVNIPNLWVMPSGPLPPNPPELLDSKAMQSVLSAIENSEFEIVIFDTTPYLALSDATILSGKVDGTLIVIDVTHTKKASLKQMKSLLTQAGTRVIGCVVNKRQCKRTDISYLSYYGGTARKSEGKESSKHGNTFAATEAIPIQLEAQNIEEDLMQNNSHPSDKDVDFDLSQATIKLPPRPDRGEGDQHD
jgi:Mrp family chromosome partitioning ATPase/capsular polysaccharide biosynthesis protein